MRRLIPLTVGLALALAAAPRAEAQYSQVRLGLLGGASTSSVGGDYISLGNWAWGGVAGAFGQYYLARETYVGLDAYWVQKGGDAVAFAFGEPQDLNLEYIEVPLTIGYASRFSDWESNLFIGVAVGFQVSCSTRGSATDTSVDCDEVPGLAPKKTVDWSIPFGLAFYRNLGGSLLGIDIRYVLGLSDTFENSNIRNRAWEFTLRWGVPLGR